VNTFIHVHQTVETDCLKTVYALGFWPVPLRTDEPSVRAV